MAFFFLQFEVTGRATSSDLATKERELDSYGDGLGGMAMGSAGGI
jgi:hypothetical protein